MRYAFKLAQSRPRKLLTVVTKSNAQRHGMVMWDEIADEVAKEFPDVTWDKMLVDAMTVRMTLKPQSLDTIVATNLHADILSDLAGALAGSLGVAPTANIDPERRFPSMFEPIHGSAFDITGKGIANPVAAFWTAAQMLDHLGEAEASARLMRAVEQVTGAGITTPDVGGTATRSRGQKARETNQNKKLRELTMQTKKTAAIALAFAMVSSASLAQNYPTRAITLLVPFAAGGATDTVARVTAQSMSKLLGQPIIIENALGAGGTIAATRASRAEPDGYTLMIHHIGISTAATLYRKLPYDTKTAFAPIGLVTNAPMTIIGRPDLPPNTLAELVTYIKANGDKMTFGNAGLGAASHLCGMLFMTAVGKEILAVPYKGNAPIMNDLIGKQIDLSCDQTTNTTAPIASKLIKSYAITTKTRLASMPDLPTADEAGLKGFEVGAWHGIYAPKGTPDDIIQKLSRTLQEALRDPDLVKRFNDINTEPVPQDQATPEALKAQLISEVDRWAPLIKAANQFAD
jgi:tripartite-type tricarboxylate transporter receptor subunit TctC